VRARRRATCRGPAEAMDAIPVGVEFFLATPGNVMTLVRQSSPAGGICGCRADVEITRTPVRTSERHAAEQTPSRLTRARPPPRPPRPRSGCRVGNMASDLHQRARRRAVHPDELVPGTARTTASAEVSTTYTMILKDVVPGGPARIERRPDVLEHQAGLCLPVARGRRSAVRGDRDLTGRPHDPTARRECWPPGCSRWAATTSAVR
jgi:hypothetical protein